MTYSRETYPQHTSRRPGPWGTDRATERKYGYPQPRRDPFADLQKRVDELEFELSQLVGRVEETKCVCPE